jgi:hypothetical protein
MDALPPDIVAAIKGGQVNVDDPATTLVLLRLNAVVGVTGFFGPDRGLRAVGIQCALCHSTVDDAFAPGIGHRLDGWPNRDLNVGAIAGLSPDLSAVDNLLGVDDVTARAVLASWGPGKFDAELFLDGKAFQPDGRSAATLLPPAFGLAGVNQHTWTGGWGTVTYWNAFVSNVEMHGSGTFFDPRLGTYTRTLDGDELDASLLVLPLYGYTDAKHPRMRSTIAEIRARLGRGSLIRRYAATMRDGLAAGEGAFGICSFWAAECRARGGDMAGARRDFEDLLGYANDVGLFAEEIDPETGAALGNFPQAFTHIGLINAAVTLGQLGGAGPAERSRP